MKCEISFQYQLLSGGGPITPKPEFFPENRCHAPLALLCTIDDYDAEMRREEERDTENDERS